MVRNSLIENIKFSEGYSDVPYQDDKGIWTIGYGTNISVITKKEAELLLRSRVDDATTSVTSIFGIGIMNSMDPEQKDSLCELMYWLGSPRFKKFKKMIKAVSASDYAEAGKQLLDSKLGRNYKTRANRLAYKLSGGI